MLHGFELWVPPVADKFDDGLPIYEIIGTDAQVVQFPLRAGRSVTCFSGAMAYMSNDVKLAVKLAGFQKTFGRLAGGGSLFQLTYTNEGAQDGYIAMTPDYPGVIVPVNMSSSGKIMMLRDSFLCSTINLSGQEVDISAGFNPAQSIAGVCCSGFDFIVQTMENGDWAFMMVSSVYSRCNIFAVFYVSCVPCPHISNLVLQAMGTVVTKNLAPGEELLVDGDAILAFDESVQIDVKYVGNVAAFCCGGEGLFNTSMRGPGKIWLQSMGIDKMRRLFPPKVVQSSSSSGGGDSGGDSGGDP